MVQIIRAHNAAVAPLISVLADAKRDAEHAVARTMLVQLASDAVGPVRGALETGDPALKVQVIDVLSRMGDRPTLLSLVRSAEDPQVDPGVGKAARQALIAASGRLDTLEEAQTLLDREVTRRLGDAVAHSGETDATVEVWHWDAEKKESFKKDLPAPVASADRAAELASDLFALRPNYAPTRRLYLTALLTAAAMDQDLDSPLRRWRRHCPPDRHRARRGRCGRRAGRSAGRR